MNGRQRKFDQSVHGSDYWQTDLDAGSGPVWVEAAAAGLAVDAALADLQPPPPPAVVYVPAPAPAPAAPVYAALSTAAQDEPAEAEKQGKYGRAIKQEKVGRAP